MGSSGVLLFVAMIAIMVAVFRMSALLTMSPYFRSRIWPWLRTRPWWPVPAERTAEALLRRLLNEREYDALSINGYVEVPSTLYAGRIYRIPRGPGQVQVVEHGRVSERLCVQPAAVGLPEADVVLMHKLLLEADERRYLLTANHFPRAVWY
ncbi:MAG TPA: hypothetical protein VF792_06120 [Ktedonobacterales bacterium]